MSHTYKHAILGGTFDHFHVGHELLITKAFDRSEHVTIGIVEQPFSSDKKYLFGIESYELRLASLQSFLLQLNVMSRVDIITIHDIYGTTLTDGTIQAIFVTDSTKPSAEKINSEREKINLPSLEIEVVPCFTGDDQEIVSSGRIRSGLMSRKGLSYLNFFLQRRLYKLPGHLRVKLQHPIGRAITDPSLLSSIIPSGSPVISVGDIVSLDVKKIGFRTAINIIDYKTRRHELDIEEIKKYFPTTNGELANPAGTINPKIADILITSLIEYDSSKESQIIKVSGEEDLLALPAILLSPLSSYVIYGQYKVGMIIVEVTEAIKSQVKTYLEQF